MLRISLNVSSTRCDIGRRCAGEAKPSYLLAAAICQNFRFLFKLIPFMDVYIKTTMVKNEGNKRKKSEANLPSALYPSWI
jgi:DNA-binding XRE family transcriptional regulator